MNNVTNAHGKTEGTSLTHRQMKLPLPDVEVAVDSCMSAASDAAQVHHCAAATDSLLNDKLYMAIDSELACCVYWTYKVGDLHR